MEPIKYWIREFFRQAMNFLFLSMIIVLAFYIGSRRFPKKKNIAEHIFSIFSVWDYCSCELLKKNKKSTKMIPYIFFYVPVSCKYMTREARFFYKIGLLLSNIKNLMRKDCAYKKEFRYDSFMVISDCENFFYFFIIYEIHIWLHCHALCSVSVNII